MNAGLKAQPVQLSDSKPRRGRRGLVAGPRIAPRGAPIVETAPKLESAAETRERSPLRWGHLILFASLLARRSRKAFGMPTNSSGRRALDSGVAGTPIGAREAGMPRHGPALKNPNGWESGSTRCRRGDVRAPRFTFVNQGARRSAQPTWSCTDGREIHLGQPGCSASTRVSTGAARSRNSPWSRTDKDVTRTGSRGSYREPMTRNRRSARCRSATHSQQTPSWT